MDLRDSCGLFLQIVVPVPSVGRLIRESVLELLPDPTKRLQRDWQTAQPLCRKATARLPTGVL